jgi:hypothetical protein
VKKILRENPKALVIFLPGTNLSIIRSTYQKINDYFKERLFDKSKLDLSCLEMDLIPSNISQDQKKKFLKDFHDHRRKLIQLRSIMNRICIVGNADVSKLKVNGEHVPNIKYPFKFFQENFIEKKDLLEVKYELSESIEQEKLAQKSKTFDELVYQKSSDKESFYKHEHLLPLSFVLKLHSMNELEKKGVNLEFIYDRSFRKNYEDDRKEVFNTKKFQERYEENVKSKSEITEWDIFSNDLDFEDLDLDEKSIKALYKKELEVSGQEKEIVKNAKISNRKIVYPLLGSWPPSNALLYRGKNPIHCERTNNSKHFMI